MAIKIKHAKVSGVADSGNTNLIQPSDWNADLETSIQGGMIAGRASAGTGPMEEISVGSGLSLSGSTLAVDAADVVTLVPSANQNNYATGISGKSGILSTIIIKPTNSIKITGIDTTGWQTGKRVRLVNGTDKVSASARMIILERNSASSLAANRMNLPTNVQGIPVFLMPGDEIEIYFNGTNLNVLSGNRIGPVSNIFDIPMVGDAGSGAWFWNNGSNSGGFANGAITIEGLQHSILSTYTGTTTSGRAFVSTDWTIHGGYGSLLSVCSSFLLQLSDSTNEFLSMAGFFDGAAGNLQNMIGWVYDRPNSTTWRTTTMKGGVATYTDSPLTVDTTTLFYLGTFVNGDGTNVEFFYSTDYGATWTFTGTQHTTNIPTGATNYFGHGFGIQKKAGTSSCENETTICGYRWQKF